MLFFQMYFQLFSLLQDFLFFAYVRTEKKMFTECFLKYTIFFRTCWRKVCSFNVWYCIDIFLFVFCKFNRFSDSCLCYDFFFRIKDSSMLWFFFTIRRTETKPLNEMLSLVDFYEFVFHCLCTITRISYYRNVCGSVVWLNENLREFVCLVRYRWMKKYNLVFASCEHNSYHVF